jgi:DNA-binding response OmpR family regulator
MKDQWKDRCILVVEDDPYMLEALGDYLQRSGATVLRALNGSIAFQLIESKRIDLVLSDVQMPVMDGIELLKRVRVKNPKVPIVLLATGQSQLTEESALALGAAGLIHKPFNLKVLGDKISELLKSTGA